MGKSQITDKKLMEIATYIGNGRHVMNLALALGLSAAEANNEGVDCYKILLKARNATVRKDQKVKLRDGLIKIGFTDAADKHLPLRNPVAKAESKTELTQGQQRKRKIEGTTLDKSPTPKKPKGLSKLKEEEQKWTKAKKELKEEETTLKDLQKKVREAEKRVDQRKKEEKKISAVVTKLKRQEYDEMAKKQAKLKQELDKLDSQSEGTS